MVEEIIIEMDDARKREYDMDITADMGDDGQGTQTGVWEKHEQTLDDESATISTSHDETCLPHTQSEQQHDPFTIYVGIPHCHETTREELKGACVKELAALGVSKGEELIDKVSIFNHSWRTHQNLKGAYVKFKDALIMERLLSERSTIEIHDSLIAEVGRSIEDVHYGYSDDPE